MPDNWTSENRICPKSEFTGAHIWDTKITIGWVISDTGNFITRHFSRIPLKITMQKQNEYKIGIYSMIVESIFILEIIVPNIYEIL